MGGDFKKECLPLTPRTPLTPSPPDPRRGQGGGGKGAGGRGSEINSLGRALLPYLKNRVYIHTICNLELFSFLSEIVRVIPLAVHRNFFIFC